jgi:hypothetical protein
LEVSLEERLIANPALQKVLLMLLVELDRTSGVMM